MSGSNKKVIVVIRDAKQQYEGLRAGLGFLLEGSSVTMVVLQHELGCMDVAYRDNMDFFDQLGGKRFSNHWVNVEKYGFSPVTLADVAATIRESDMFFPF